MAYQLSTDVGGTFTDLVVIDDHGRVSLYKSPTVPGNQMEGILAALRVAAREERAALDEFLANSAFFSHGSTVSTNALIEGTSARVGLICTKGHRDVLLFREGEKENPFDWSVDYPEPFVPRSLTVPVAERISSSGDIVVPLNEDEVREAVSILRQKGVDAIAVALLWAFQYPVHEERIAAIVEEEWPGVPCSLSHRVAPVAREYRRTVACAMDASLRPLVSRYLDSLQTRLRADGYRGKVNVLTSSGGVASPQEVVRNPLLSLDSGPALAPVAGRFYAGLELDGGDVITCDMGGTSFDVARVTGGEIAVTRDYAIGTERLSQPKVDCRTVGAGGGSIARVDEAGLLHVGPQSAGSEPGPACYSRGGELPTVTDAALILGYYDAEYFLGGSMPLHRELAATAIRQHVARPLGLDLEDAAYAIWQTVCATMTEAVREITVKVGIDPADYAYVAGGGAAGAHIAPIVQGLGGHVAVLPRTAGTLSAFGGAIADVTREFYRSCHAATTDFPRDRVNAVLAELVAEAHDFLEACDIDPGDRVLRFFVDARYAFQDRELTISLPHGHFDGPDDVDGLVASFHAAHDRALGSCESGDHVECVVWTVRAIGKRSTAAKLRTRITASGGLGPALKSHRDVYCPSVRAYLTTAIYEGGLLPPGALVEGPAVIEEPTTSLVVFAGQHAQVTEHGNFLLRV